MKEDFPSLTYEDIERHLSTDKAKQAIVNSMVKHCGDRNADKFN